MLKYNLNENIMRAAIIESVVNSCLLQKIIAEDFIIHMKQAIKKFQRHEGTTLNLLCTSFNF